MTTLVEKLNQQEAKIKQLELTCNNRATAIQQLTDTVSHQKDDIINLNLKLQEKEKLLNIYSDNILNGHSYETERYLHCEGYNRSSSSSQDSVVSNDNFECGPPPIIVNGSNECSDAAQELRLSPIMVYTYILSVSFYTYQTPCSYDVI